MSSSVSSAGENPTRLSAREARVSLARPLSARDPIEAGPLLPLVNLCFAEVLRTVEQDRLCNGPADLSGLERLVARARAMAGRGQAGVFPQTGRDVGLLLLDFAGCFVASRSGRTDDADACYLACLERSTCFPRTSWVHAVVWWARVERAVAHGDIETSIASLQAMGEVAQAGAHAQFQALAETLAETLRPPLNQGNSIL